MDDLIKKASQIYKNNFSNECYFERAVFLSWYCSKGDCKFCWMSTQKNRIRNPKLAIRRLESILAEVLICKLCNWKIEFLSGGYETYSLEELINIIKNINLIYKERLWLNIGVLNRQELLKLKPFIKGITGAVETINPRLHKELCPSKPLKEIEEMFKICDELKIKKSITIIIGLGETIEDFELLKRFIKKYKISRITYYALNPHKGTIFKKGPDTGYYIRWIANTRIAFPKIEIIAGSWHSRLDEIHLLLKAGANSITKFKSIKLFNTELAKNFENQVEKANRKFKSRLVDFPKFGLEDELRPFENELKTKIINKFNEYYKKKISKNEKTY
ncbi:radical SAM protein [Candidatus Woesearchaeota archaeon]|nr:radical SAM protein [Candidatus Woesearchaeota archaeon]